MKRPATDRLVASVLVASFAIGTHTQTLHLAIVGWTVFDAAPVWINVYWTALSGLDPVAAVLLLYRRLIGLGLGAPIALSDVGINSYAIYDLGLPLDFLSLQLRSLFCGFLLGAVGFLAAGPGVGEPRK